MRTGAADPKHLGRLVGATVAAVYLLFLSEWLFLVTKPSMFALVGWPQRVAVLLAAALYASIPVAGATVVVALSWGRLPYSWRGRAVRMALILPAAVLSACGFLLIENFTRTVLGFNVGSFTSPVRYLYLIAWLLLAWWIHRSLAGRVDSGSHRGSRALAAAGMLVFLVSAFAAWVRYEPWQATAIGVSDDRQLPNILILATDGLDASNMSVHGYERPTTPFLESRSDEFLISENHFSNSARTGPSIGALLTGKLPTETGVVRLEMAFLGEHAFQHLPGLLRQLGYYNIDIGMRMFADAYDMNIRQGFHVANGRSLKTETPPMLGWMGRAYPLEFYFVGLTLQRVRQRFLHAAGIEDMEDLFDAVAKKSTPHMSDEDRVELLRAELGRAPRPFFAHVHLLDTHRPFAPHIRLPRFSAKPEPDWRDLYDDLIAGYDDYVRQIVADLEAAGELDNTVLILNSDHGVFRHPWVRLPLMIRFPGAEHGGRIHSNTQRVDIAPTILDYLGVEPPGWMAGQSLIGPEPDPLRPVLVAGWGGRTPVYWLSLVQCQRTWAYDARNGNIGAAEVTGHTAPCPEGDLLGEAEARRFLHGHLEASGAIPIYFLARFSSLKEVNNPETRRQVLLAIRDGEAPTLRLGKAITMAELSPDFWTSGDKPAALLLRNDDDAPRTFKISVGSGRKRAFPVSFFVQDDRQTREHSFKRPGALTVELGPVAPGTESLFLIWSGTGWVEGEGARNLGVRLDPAGPWLHDLLRTRRSSDWQRAAEMILQRRVAAIELDDGWLAANVHGDLWTRGSQPAGLAVRNDGDRPLSRRLVVQSGAGNDFPLRLHLDDGSRSREYVLERPGKVVVELPQVAPGSQHLFILRSEGAWKQRSAGRELGVRLAPAERRREG